MKDEIISSWEKNAAEWVSIIDAHQISSRQYTNAAIMDVLNESSSEKILDLGCGEGWLTRTITKTGKKAVGIDAVEQLLNDAREKGPETYYQMSYEEIIAGKTIPDAPFDIAIFNFCLYQKEGVPALFKKVKNTLSLNGRIIVQTLHPYFLVENRYAYKSQLISNSWKGLPGNFTNGHHWYARTFEDWIAVFSKCNMKVNEIREVTNNENQPISLILIAQ